MLEDQLHVRFFLGRIMTSPKSKLYERYTSYFKSVINEETIEHTSYLKHHLRKQLDKQSLFSFSKFRVSNHILEIELGRYKNIPAEERHCRICKSSQIEDEFYFIMCCRVYSELRARLFKKLCM